MASDGLRRSSRLEPYDSNGRLYLADQLGWSRKQLETWITSITVQPHLRLWYQICIGSPRRFNDAVDWINGGEGGYYYNEEGLEEDLLLLCLSDGSADLDTSVPSHETDATPFDNAKKSTTDWPTQAIWARAAWRIVHANKQPGQAFASSVNTHTAACYSFVIDLLCLAFHSIAHRGAASVYTELINSDGPRADNDTTVPQSSGTQSTQRVVSGDDSSDSGQDGFGTSESSLICDQTFFSPQTEISETDTNISPKTAFEDDVSLTRT